MKIIKACWVVGAVCSIIIAGSLWEIGKEQRRMTVVQAMSGNSFASQLLNQKYGEMVLTWGWSHKDALDSLYHYPIHPKDKK